MAQIFAYIAHKNGVVEDSAAELAVAAKKIDAAAQVTAIVTGSGSTLDAASQGAAKLYAQVWKVDNAALAYPNGEVVRKLLAKIVPAGSIVLIPHDTFGMDMAPGLSIKLDAAYAPDIVGLDGLSGATLKAVRQEFSVTDKSGDAGDLGAKRRFLQIVEAETGDVDITKADVLVSVGRGIEDAENISIAQELAEAMGAVVSCSRPIVDAKWLEKSRQVGTSGKTVKPKVYMAMGISGSFQHLGGLKGSPFIVAVNKNPKAPIFQVADVGIVENILEFMPALTEKISG
ncbi:MAG: electron transfer flavoprotein subunit alpha/FixB family protein [Desulfatitalea sp.]|nr:electron transfer flavoprotein subunit alpha/FixB family protein [Desulfatitalea sp.]